MSKKRKVDAPSLNSSPEAPAALGKAADTKASYAQTAKNGNFGREVKDSQPVFEIRLAAPGTVLQIKDVIKEMVRLSTRKDSLFGVRLLGNDLVASFHEERERNELAARGSINVSGTNVSLAVFPLPSRPGAKYFLYGVPMSATASAVGKALEPLEPGKHYFETYQGTSVRTGRVVFWTENPKPPQFVRVNDVKVNIKAAGKTQQLHSESEAGKSQQEDSQMPLAEEADKPLNAARKQKQGREDKEEKGTKPGPSMAKGKEPAREEPATPTHQTRSVSRAQQEAMLVDSAPQTPQRRVAQVFPLSPSGQSAKEDPLTWKAPIVNQDFLDQLGLEMTGKYAVLSIYEELDKPEDAVEVSKQIPSPVGKVVKTQIPLPRDPGKTDLFNFNVLEDDAGGYQKLAAHYASYAYGPEQGEYDLTSRRWVQEVVLKGDKIVLVLFKTRILRFRKK